MRVIPCKERKQRGCSYCFHVETIKYDGKYRNACPYSKCQYPVLDKYKTYEEFMESEDSKILVDEFFTSVAGCYELASVEKKQNRLFSDGDGRLHL